MDFGKLAQQAQSALGGGGDKPEVADEAGAEDFASKAKAFAASTEGKKAFADAKGAFDGEGGAEGFAADAKAFAGSAEGKDAFAAAKAKLF